jgi:delta8-fatty-acid desaturase
MAPQLKEPAQLLSPLLDDIEPEVGEKKTTKTKAAKRSALSRAEVLELADPETLCLFIVNDKIYDATKWQNSHPGGNLTIRALCGKDGTDAFMSSHPDYVKDRLLKNFFYGDLKNDENYKDDEATIAFRELTRKIKDAGLFQTDYTFYYKKAAVFAGMFSLVLAGVLLSDRLSVHALAGIMLGLFWQQTAFVGHDLGHNAVTHNRELDSFWGLFVGNFCSGISMAWWKRSHNVHHIVTNSCEHDPDIQHLPVFAVDKFFLQNKIYSTFFNHVLPLDASAHVLVKFQHYLYYPVMAVARFNLYVQSLTHALGVGMYSRSEKIWRRDLQVPTLIAFWVWLLTLTMQLPNWTSRVVFFLLAHAVAGVLHVQITLSHFSMPAYSGVTYDNCDNGFLQTQLKGSLDVDCPPWMDWFHGGLQFQVIHHLWPKIPRHNLRTIKPMLIAFCKEHDLVYNQATFVKCNQMMLGKLKETAKHTRSFSELFGDSWNMKG